MTDWPLILDGREYQPIPESWVEHGVDAGNGHPRVYAVSAAFDESADLLHIRYAHPTNANVLEATTGACAASDGNGAIPSALASPTSEWPRSLVPDGTRPTGVTRRPEPAHLRDLWADRVDEIESDGAVVADAGQLRAVDALGDVCQLHLSDFRWYGGAQE